MPEIRVDQEEDRKPTLPSPESSPSSPTSALVEISPEQQCIAPGSVPQKTDIADKVESKTRFPARTEDGERQCTNCSETDTPQWRGTLCNACALWKRSRGSDRPLPLVFSARKRPRSPSPLEVDIGDEEEGDERDHMRGNQGSTISSPIHPYYNTPQYQHQRACLTCGQMAVTYIGNRPFCHNCARDHLNSPGRYPPQVNFLIPLTLCSLSYQIGSSTPFNHMPLGLEMPGRD